MAKCGDTNVSVESKKQNLRKGLNNKTHRQVRKKERKKCYYVKVNLWISSIPKIQLYILYVRTTIRNDVLTTTDISLPE